jgi:hypothetical protein
MRVCVCVCVLCCDCVYYLKTQSMKRCHFDLCKVYDKFGYGCMQNQRNINENLVYNCDSLESKVL